MNQFKLARLLVYVTGLINQKLLLQNEYLVAENRILRAHLPSRLRLTDPQRSTLTEIGKRLGRKALAEVAVVAKPETILDWYRRLIAQKFDGSKHRCYPGRSPVGEDVVQLIVRMARENSGWGYDRIAGALSNLGHKISDHAVGNILHRARYRPRSETQPVYYLEEIHRRAYGRAGRNRLLHSGSADLARSRHLLRPVLHSVGNQARHSRRSDDEPDGGMDGANCPECGRP